MFSVTISDEAAEVNIIMNTSLSIICGNSGTGKTLLCNVIRRIQERGQQTDAQKIFVVDNYQLFKLIPYSSCEVVLIDKCEQYLEETELIEMLQYFKHKYIIFARSGMLIPSTIFDIADLNIKNEGRHVTFSICNSLRKPE